VETNRREIAHRLVSVAAITASKECVDSQSLLGPIGKLVIIHDDDEYQLGITKSGEIDSG
jgi:hemin uptake protein HemP